MASKHLSVVQGDGSPPASADPSAVYDLGRGPDTVADRILRLQEEARVLAREEIQSFENYLLQGARMAQSIAQGGEAYPVGVRSMAEQIAEELPLKVQSLRAIQERLRRS
jgi:hypothetical protein